MAREKGSALTRAARPRDEPQSSRRNWSELLDRTFKYWALAPAVLLLALLTLYPALQLLRMSVSTINISGQETRWQFVGLAHVHTLLADPVVSTALKNTLIFVVVVVAIETALGLFLAIMVSRTRQLSLLYRTMFVLPLLIPPIAIGTMWRLMYDYNYGIINQMLALIGLAGPTWTADPTLALPSVMIVDIWHWTSFLFLIFLAGVESLPYELSEAARVDGASELQVYRHILLPLLRPTILVALLLRTIFAFKVFDEIFLLTKGGPGTATQVISLYIHEIYFTQFRTGYGALLALVTAMIISLFVIFYQRIIIPRTKEVEV